MLGAVTPALGGVGLANLAARTPGFLGGAARTGLSALEGAGYGATAAATDKDENTTAGSSALLGAAFGGGGGLLGETVGAGWRGARSLLGFGDDAAATVGKIAAKNPRARQQLEALGPEGAVADVLGEEGKTLIRKAADKSPSARQILEDEFGERAARQPQNIIKSLEDAAEIAPDHRLTPDELVEQLREHRRPGIRQAYREAEEAGYKLPRETRARTIREPVPPGNAILEEGATNVTPQQYQTRVVEDETEIPAFFADLLSTPSGRRAWRKAAMDRADWRPTEGDIVDSDLWRLDATKKNLDGLASEAFRAGNRTKGTKLSQLAEALRNRMDGLLDLPEYARARAKHAGMEEEISAIGRGADLAKTRYPPTLPREAIAAREGPRGSLLGKAQAQGYAHEKIGQLLGDKTLGAGINRFKSAMNQEGATAALGSKADQVEEAVRRADIFRETHHAVKGGSPTSRNIAADIMQLLGPGNLTAGAVGAGLGLAQGIASGDPSAWKTALTGLTAYGISKGYNKLQMAKLEKLLPEIAQILVSRNIPPAAQAPGRLPLGSIGASGAKLLGSQ